MPKIKITQYSSSISPIKSSCVCVWVLSHFSHVQLFATLWPVVCQASLTMGFSRQQYWTRFPCSPPGDLPDPGIYLHLLYLLHWQAGSLLLGTPGKPHDETRWCIKKQIHHFADKSPDNQSYGFSSNHVWMWEFDHKEGWVTIIYCWATGEAHTTSH